MENIKIGISIGDINGVGLEVIIKALSNNQIMNFCTPVIYGSSKVVSYHKNIVEAEDFQYVPTKAADRLTLNKVNVVNCWQDNVNITLGKMSELSGKYAKISLEQATHDLKAGLIDAVVTAPINKKAMGMVDFPYPGHTEYFANELEGSESLMLMVADTLRIGVVTGHIPLREVSTKVTKELITRKLKVLNKALKMDFGLEKPIIAILGLNPHASDNGLIGDEEEKLIRPVIIEAKKKGVIAMGPFSADGFFGSDQYKKFDGILAMYHDQGLIPFKTISFGTGVNFTAGLSHIRTSPDHGTAYEIAGQNQANPASFRQAIFQAIDIVRNRKNFKEIHANPIVKKEKPIEQESGK